MQVLIEVLEDRSPPVDPDAELTRGHAARRAGDTAAARDAYLLALSAYVGICDGHGEALSLSALGELALDGGDVGEACTRLREAAAVWRAAGDGRALAAALCTLGAAERQAGDRHAARATLTAALRAAERIDDPRLCALVHVNTAHLDEDGGATRGARRHLSRAARLLRAAGDRRGEAGALASLGVLHRNAGHPRRAAPCFGRALELCAELGDTEAAAWVEEQLRSLHPAARGRRPDVPAASQAPAVTPIALGRRALRDGGVDEARRLGEQVVDDCERLGRRQLAAAAHCLLAEVHLATGRSAGARAELGRALAELGDAPSPERLHAVAGLARADLLDADVDGAEARVAEVLRLVEDGSDADVAAGLLLELGDALERRDDAEAARRAWARCAELERAGARDAAVRVAAQRLGLATMHRRARAARVRTLLRRRTA